MPASLPHRSSFLLLAFVLLACGPKRGGLPENQRNYSNEAIEKVQLACRSDMEGLHVFHHLDADSVAEVIHAATLKYFGPDFTTVSMQKKVRDRLRDEFTARAFRDNSSWKIETTLDMSRLVCGDSHFFWFDVAGGELSYHTTICLKKMLDSLGQYSYSETSNHTTMMMPRTHFLFLCDYHIDIEYLTRSMLSGTKHEYYRETLTDTIDLYSLQGDYRSFR